MTETEHAERQDFEALVRRADPSGRRLRAHDGLCHLAAVIALRAADRVDEQRQRAIVTIRNVHVAVVEFLVRDRQPDAA